MATFLKLLSSNLVCKPHLGVNLNLWSQIPPNSLPGGGGLYFGGRWVVATFLKLLSSNLVCKSYLGTNFNFWSQIPQTPLPGGLSRERRLYFGGRWVMATFLKLLSSNLVCKPHLSVNLNLWSQNPSTPSPGVPPPGGGGLYFRGTWVMATFLRLLSSNLVCKPYLGTNFNFWRIVATFLKLLISIYSSCFGIGVF